MILKFYDLVSIIEIVVAFTWYFIPKLNKILTFRFLRNYTLFYFTLQTKQMAIFLPAILMLDHEISM